ncbi:MAG: response regulator [Acidobacteriota bacterium]
MHRHKILVVEDFEDSRFSLCKLLELEGFEVLEAVNGQQAVTVAHNAQPDCILMDLSLPVMSGIEATREIRLLPRLHSIPIIAVSAHDTQNFLQDALASGCNDYIIKPVDFDNLLNLLKKYFSQ